MGDNPTGDAMSLPGAQLTTIEDIVIRGNFNVGINSLPGSGGSTTNVKIVGGNIGIRQSVYRPTPSIHGLELVDQGLRHRAGRRARRHRGRWLQDPGQRRGRRAYPDQGQRLASGAHRHDGRDVRACRPGDQCGWQRDVPAQRVRQDADDRRQCRGGRPAGGASAWTKVGEYATTDGGLIVVDGASPADFRSPVSSGRRRPT